MMHRNAKRQTAAERARNDRIMSMHCIVCALSGDFAPRKLECQHIVRANKRLGHWFTIPLCLGHHQGKWSDQVVQVGIADGRHAFKEAHGYDELELWQKLQVTLGLPDDLPASKIISRRLDAYEHL